MSESTCQLKIALDMSFDELMSEKDQRRAVHQIGWCYTANRHAPEPFQFYIVGFNGPTRHIYDNVPHNRNQDIFLKESKLEETFELENIVYLTAESDNVLGTLEDSKVYVIGGLVDHNSQKGLCHKLAVEKGFNHARLPIDEFVNLKTRKVLTINHVFEILVHYNSSGNWEQAFFSVIPQRKGMQKKEETEGSS
ncbi:unnamed protein product [Caenorhabditis auriculariae]|uniref:tRNA (guanine(9)-N(1))-methyltransferase n=1 Tax=Caenorhabditis auriculariae TaxID=2777116 RepID=A0A8S1HN42_9PELO|nr:unnamed protein product [Caenorhabditis auriculariae]